MARVGEIISRAGAHPDPSIPPTHGAQGSVVSPSNHRIAAAALCALLSQTEVTLQQGDGISPGAVVLVEKLILDLSNASYVWSSDVPSAELEAVGKAHRALERVRRTSIKLFEDANLDVVLRDALKRLQSSIVDLMANTLSHVRSSIICDTRPNPSCPGCDTRLIHTDTGFAVCSSPHDTRYP